MLNVLGGMQRRISMPALAALLARQTQQEAQFAYAAQLLHDVAAASQAASLPEYFTLFPPRGDRRSADMVHHHVLRRLTAAVKGDRPNGQETSFPL